LALPEIWIKSASDIPIAVTDYAKDHTLPPNNYRTEVPLIGATDKELRADGNIYAGAIPGCFIIELSAQLAHQLAP
jgi:hypothetical protein